MALLVDTNYKGVPVFGAYVTVELPTVGRQKDKVEFGVWFRATSDSPEPFHSVTHEAPYTLEGGDPFLQAYSYLKTLPEFADAIVC